MLDHPNNKDFVLNAVKQDGMLLQYANDLLKDDFEIVYEAVNQNVFSYEYASLRLQSDIVIKMFALNKIFLSKYLSI